MTSYIEKPQSYASYYWDGDDIQDVIDFLCPTFIPVLREMSDTDLDVYFPNPVHHDHVLLGRTIFMDNALISIPRGSATWILVHQNLSTQSFVRTMPDDDGKPSGFIPA